MAGSVITPVALWGPQAVSTSAAVVFTSATNTLSTINRAVFNNSTTTNIGLTVWVVRSGSTTSNTALLIGASGSGYAISAGPTTPYISNEMASMVLNAGDAIWAQASTTGLVTVASGWQQ